MATGEMLEVEFPVMRYDITMPFLEGRVTVDGVTLKPVKTSSMISKVDPKLKAGEFGLCDLNLGYLLRKDKLFARPGRIKKSHSADWVYYADEIKKGERWTRGWT